MNILVTGTAGFIGFHTVKRLLSLGHNVTELDHINDYYDINLKHDHLPETEWVETVEAGWNILKSIDDPDFAEVIVEFNPSSNRPDLYGKDVAKRMVAEIERWLEQRRGLSA